MRQILLVVAIVFGVCSLVSVRGFSKAITRVCVIVNTDDAPVEILEFKRYYPDEDENHISSELKYKNKTDRDIEALAITIIYYNLFNDKEDEVKGVSTKLLKAQKVNRGRWSTGWVAVLAPQGLRFDDLNPLFGRPNFVKTAIAFVSTIRFLDGEVWKADIDEVFKIAADLPGLEFLQGRKIFSNNRIGMKIMSVLRGLRKRLWSADIVGISLMGDRDEKVN